MSKPYRDESLAQAALQGFIGVFALAGIIGLLYAFQHFGELVKAWFR